MGSRELAQVGLVLVLVAKLCGGAMAQSGCASALTGLVPCLGYVTGNSSTPSSSCCSQLANVVQSSPQCLCSVLNGGASNIGITINQTQALSLPGACNVKTPPAARCNAANGPITSPVGSPAIPPADASNETPDDDGSVSPSASQVPSASGSKVVPSTHDGSTSVGISIMASGPLHLAVLIAFVITVSASTLTIC